METQQQDLQVLRTRLQQFDENCVTDAIRKHEPRARTESVDVSQSNINEGLLYIHISYSIKSTNSRFNMVFPFYVNEAAAPAG